jgi:heat shock protein HslJ
MNKLFPVLWIMILLGLTACSSVGEGSLAGKVWVLESLNNASPVENTTITAEFTPDGKVSGSGGCNSYSGGYRASANSIQFEPVASTMMACDQPIMDQEQAYFQALNAAKRFSIQGDQLTLSDTDGTALASFQAQSQSLEGTSWEVISYNNGKQAVTGALAGTELSADFGKDGSVSGFAGCNNYSGTFQTDADKITISPLVSTMMFCSNPEG